MVRMRLADTASEIGRIQGAPPPLVRLDLQGDTHVSRPWQNRPFESYVPGMRHHVIAAVLRGDGSTTLRTDGKRLQEPSITGTSVLMPKGHDGWWHRPGSPVCSNVYLGEQRLQLCADELGRGERPELVPGLSVTDPKLFKILSLIADEAVSQDAISKLYVEQLLDLLCLQLLRTHSASPLQHGDHGGGLSPWQVKRVLDYMQDRLDQELGLQELSDLVQLSRFHFCRAFRRSTGYTPHQWLVRTRLREARRLLADPGLTITEVALAVGYQTPSAFSLAFRTMIGVTPSAYRRLRQT